MVLDWEKHKEKYYTDGHFHVTYYENGYDIEGEAWKRKDGKGWDVLFYDGFHDITDSIFDIVIFTYEKNELDQEEINQMFHEWVEREFLPNVKDREQYKYSEDF